MTKKNIKALKQPIFGEVPTIHYVDGHKAVLEVRVNNKRYCSLFDPEVSYTKGQIAEIREYLTISILNHQYRDEALAVATLQGWRSPDFTDAANFVIDEDSTTTFGEGMLIAAVIFLIGLGLGTVASGLMSLLA